MKPQGRREEIILLGLFGIGNFGNEGSLSAALRFLRLSASDPALTAICTYPENVQRDHGIRALPLRSQVVYRRSPFFIIRLLQRVFVRFPREIKTWIQATRRFRRVSSLIIPGTGILDDYAVDPFDLPYALFKWCLCARIAGAKVFFVSVGAGPIHHPLSRWFMKNAAKAAYSRSYRDQKSKVFMQSIGLDVTHDAVYPDLVFSLTTASVAGSTASPEHPLVIGIGLMAYYGWQNDAAGNEGIFESYIEKMADFSRNLLSRGYVLRLIIGELSDRKAVSRLIERIGPDISDRYVGKISAVTINSIHDVLSEMTQVDAVVATRFHNVVCALMLDRPILSIGYADKNDSLMSDMGLGDYCQSLESLDLSVLNRQFDSMILRRNEISVKITTKRMDYQARLQQQFTIVLNKAEHAHADTRSRPAQAA